MVFGRSEAYWLAELGRLKWILLLAAFTACALWETFAPRRKLAASAAWRWSQNAALDFLFNSPLVWLLRLNAVFVAFWVQDRGYGLLHRLPLFWWLRFAAGILLLDLLRYAQHLLYHHNSLLWRVHQVHHSDPDFDWSTGLLFHPGELLVTQGSYLAAIILLAPPPAAVIALELLTAAQNFFVHANVRMPHGLERGLRRIFITPEMHRIHHSADLVEQSTNFGDVFPWWDRFFGTYRHDPAAGHERMKIGLAELGDHRGLNVLAMLALPFRGKTAVTDDEKRPVAVTDRAGLT